MDSGQLVVCITAIVVAWLTYLTRKAELSMLAAKQAHKCAEDAHRRLEKHVDHCLQPRANNDKKE